MARVKVDETSRTGGDVEQFDRLKLKKGEYARLVLPTDDAEMQWVHTIRAPSFDENGRPIMKELKRKDNSVYGTTNETEFVGQRICLGNPLVLQDKSLDADNCPVCASALRGTKDMEPVRRYALPVVKYETKAGGTDLRSPVGGKLLVWTLTERMYRDLLDTRKAMLDLLQMPDTPDFHLRAADVVILCEDEGYQRMLWKPPLRPAYAHPRVGEWIKELLGDKSNWPTDAQLTAACGREGHRGFMAQDVETAEAAWRRAEGKAPAEPDPTAGSDLGGPDLTAGLDSLLDDPAAGAVHPGGLQEFAPPGVTVPDPFGDSTPAAAPAAAPDPFGDSAPAAAPAAEATPFAAAAAASPAPDPFGDSTPVPAPAAAANGAKPAMSFDDILGG